MSDIFEKVKTVVATQLDVETSAIVPEARFIEDLGADSLVTVELIMALEEEFGCEIPEDQAEQIKTVSDVVELLTSNAVSA